MNPRSPTTTRPEPAKAPRELELPEAITVRDLSNMLGVSPIDVIKELMRAGVMVTVNQPIGFDMAALVCKVYGRGAKPQPKAEAAKAAAKSAEEDQSKLVARPPVVTVLGHVDHGKTTLLDAIRKTKVAEGEVGGITQHIGAYQVEYKGQKITFLDTPGHEAFTSMRARGARVTDIAVLVVAADDGVMPQTIEAINHAKAASVPIIVAINKMDKSEANPDRVKRQLSEQGLVLEEWGGDVISVPVSAKKREGIDELLETILAVTEVGELKANPERSAAGVVIEARLDKNRGPVATVLVQNGTLQVGDIVVAGSAFGRVKAMVMETGRRMKRAGPSTPAELLGLNSTPEAGDPFEVVADERTARERAEQRSRTLEAEKGKARPLTLEDAYARISAGEVKELNLILKADVQGSVEAISAALVRLASSQAKVRLLQAGSGTITESDVLLAAASKAIILGFSTRAEAGVPALADREGVEIRSYDIIYRVVEDVEKALKGMLEPTVREVVEGRAEVRAVFPAGKGATVAGCMVTTGKLTRSASIRVIRKGKVAFDGPMISLRHFKQDVTEMAAGFECGVRLDGFNDCQAGDILEAYRQEKVKA